MVSGLSVMSSALSADVATLLFRADAWSGKVATCVLFYVCI